MNANRRKFMGLGILAAAGMTITPGITNAADASSGPMDVFTALKTRRSVRAYTAAPVSDEDIQKILEAAMLAPSAANEQPWEFVVIRNREIRDKIPEINSYASYIKKSPVSILVCLNEHKEKIKGMGIIDVSMCAENLLLAAHGLGLGAVFTGIYPEKDRIEGFQKLVGLPDYVIPIGLIIMGHPEIPGLRTADDRFNKAAIHNDKWQESGPSGK